MTDRGPLPSFLMDMDGVLVHEEQAIPGADRFIKALQAAGLPFLVLTNNSIYTQRDLAARLARSGIELAPSESGPRRWPPPSSSTRSVPVGQRT
jgi:NagD protein